MDTIPGQSYLTDEQWVDTRMCSDVEIERLIHAANARAHEEQQKLKDEEPRLMLSQGISRTITRSERCIQIKIARKIHSAICQKRNLDGLYEVLAPRSTVGNVSQPTSLLKKT